MIRRKHAQGFTLVETMIVVAIIAVLATLAVYGVKNYVMAAKSSEAIEMIQQIKAAQESYKDETFTYLDISDDLATLYPIAQSALGNSKRAWGGQGTDLEKRWNQLGVRPNAPVQFGYACVAGPASEAVAGVPAALNYPEEAPGPWYVVKAMADRDDDDNFAVFIGSSFTDEIYSEQDTE